MMQSLDGYIAGRSGGPQPDGLSQAAAELPPPGPTLSRHFNDLVRGSDSFLYGRRIYEVMRYWDEDQPDWDEISMISPKSGVRNRSGLHHVL